MNLGPRYFSDSFDDYTNLQYYNRLGLGVSLSGLLYVGLFTGSTMFVDTMMLEGFDAYSNGARTNYNLGLFYSFGGVSTGLYQGTSVRLSKAFYETFDSYVEGSRDYFNLNVKIDNGADILGPLEAVTQTF